MEHKRDLTRDLLAECMHELVLKTSFDKITIKMITDRAGLIRPTFYKHFQDKYEVLEYIFTRDITTSVDLLLEHHMEKDAVTMFFRCMDKDRKFYRRVWQMEPGPNSFEQLLIRYIHGTLLKVADDAGAGPGMPSILTAENIAAYYTYSTVYIIRDWLLAKEEISADTIAEACDYLLDHSAEELLRRH